MKSASVLNKELLTGQLASLGVAFINVSIKEIADPERTILEAARDFKDDRKLLSLILGWLALYSDLIHVARLKSMLKNCSAEELAWLGGLASAVSQSDRRWSLIESYARKRIGRSSITIKTYDLDLLAAKRSGEDPHFHKFGLTIPKASPALEKKFYSREHTIANHPWLRLRALFGANWRADIAWQMLCDKKQTPYRVARTVGCNIETAYRNWQSLLEADASSALQV